MIQPEQLEKLFAKFIQHDQIVFSILNIVYATAKKRNDRDAIENLTYIANVVIPASHGARTIMQLAPQYNLDEEIINEAIKIYVVAFMVENDTRRGLFEGLENLLDQYNAGDVLLASAAMLEASQNFYEDFDIDKISRPLLEQDNLINCFDKHYDKITEIVLSDPLIYLVDGGASLLANKELLSTFEKCISSQKTF